MAQLAVEFVFLTRVKLLVRFGTSRAVAAPGPVSVRYVNSLCESELSEQQQLAQCCEPPASVKLTLTGAAVTSHSTD